MSLRLATVSDMHGTLKDYALSSVLPDADVLVMAGDICRDFGRPAERGAELQLRWLTSDFLPFLATLRYRKILCIAGNHDWVFSQRGTASEARRLLNDAGVTYLEDESCDFEGVSFYGSPHQPEFMSWAFNLPRDGHELASAWDKIPQGTDVLVTHGPPLGILDRPHGTGPPVGCKLLRERVRALKPRAHIFGHIHGSYGKHHEDGTWFLNASLCDESYDPVQAPLVIDV
jgi:Icc-related predicted phosphoesterase